MPLDHLVEKQFRLSNLSHRLVRFWVAARAFVEYGRDSKVLVDAIVSSGTCAEWENLAASKQKLIQDGGQNTKRKFRSPSRARADFETASSIAWSIPCLSDRATAEPYGDRLLPRDIA